MCKFAVQPADGRAGGQYVRQNSNPRAPTDYKALHTLIREQSMDPGEANTLINKLRSGNEILPFKNRQEFLKYVAAFVRVYNQ